MEKSGDFSVAVDDDIGIEEENEDRLGPPDELDRNEINETEDLDDKNAIRFILKVYDNDDW
jgi:hypothetical protein